MFDELIGKRSGSREVRLKVTERGFEPARVPVARGEVTTLIVTRTTERTCAREFVLDELGIRVELPLDTPVRITLEPSTSGAMSFGCAMGKMVRGVVDVS